MTIIFCYLLLVFFIEQNIALHIVHSGDLLLKLNNFTKPSFHTIVKRKVPLKEEIEFYKTISKIKPETLALLMPNISRQPYVRTPPSNRCCYNGGTCFVPTNDRSDRFCKCPPNFKGRYCDEDVDECQVPDDCNEHEVCKNTYGSYECNCADGYARERLQCIRKVSCYEEPCVNFSDCVDVEEGRVSCICRPGFKGIRCEIRIPECEDSSCNEDETCVATSDGYNCMKM